MLPAIADIFDPACWHPEPPSPPLHHHLALPPCPGLIDASHASETAGKLFFYLSVDLGVRASVPPSVRGASPKQHLSNHIADRPSFSLFHP